MSPEDDPQRDAVYKFEDAFPWAWQNSMTLAQCRMLVRSACQAYGVEPPTVVQHKRRSLSWCIPSRRQISLQAVGPGNRGGKNASTALHEAAHQIVYDYCGDRVQDHGMTFCGVYFWLLVKAGWPEVAIHAVARSVGLRWADRPPAAFLRSQKERPLGRPAPRKTG